MNELMIKKIKNLPQEQKIKKEYLNGNRAQTNLFEQADEETRTLKVVGA